MHYSGDGDGLVHSAPSVIHNLRASHLRALRAQYWLSLRQSQQHHVPAIQFEVTGPPLHGYAALVADGTDRLAVLNWPR